MKKIRFFTLLVMVLLTALIVTGCQHQSQPSQPVQENRVMGPETGKPEGLLKVHFLDVGQGDAILVQTPMGENLLIDAGDRDQGNMVVSYLEQAGVTKLTAVVGTHPHADHIGGLAEVIRHFPVEAVYMPRVNHSSDTFLTLLQTIEQKGLKIKTARAGVTLPLEGAEAAILSPLFSEYSELNDYSAVIALTFGQNRFLLMGDAGQSCEADLLKNGDQVKAGVLKIGHHGSSSASSQAFLQAVGPAYAVISCGSGNDYGHPRRETLQALGVVGSEILRTDQQGTIVITSNGQSLQVNKKGIQARAGPTPNAGDSSSNCYIGNQKSLRFHRSTCRTLPAEANRVYFSTRDEALAQGFKPCGNCKP